MRIPDFNSFSEETLHNQLKKARWIVLLIFVILITRLWFLQIINGPMYRLKSERNRIRLHEIFPPRGLILDRNGEVLADNIPTYDLYIIPEEIKDRDLFINKLENKTGLSIEEIKGRFPEGHGRYSFRPVLIKENVSRKELAVIETHKYDLPGIMIKVRPKRYYLNNNFAYHLLGYLGKVGENQLRSGQFLNFNPESLIGKSGIELRWQEFLQGEGGGEQVETDAEGRKIELVSYTSPVPGANIYLTIDKHLQKVAEDSLVDKKGAIVAINPQDGEIIAIASSPSIDPNLFADGIDRTTWSKIMNANGAPLQNKAVTGQYPPASLFKIIVAIAGLEEGLITTSDRFLCEGVFEIGDYKYRCWNKSGHGNVNLDTALASSCDVYFYKLGKKLGVDKIAFYARKFGLGRKTGFDVGCEEAGLVPDKSWKYKALGEPWQIGETISMAIGQSYVLVTPIQMAVAFSSIFNGGILFQPQVTKSINRTGTGKIYEFQKRISGEINVKAETLEIIKKALVRAVNGPNGTASKASIEGITVAGKTGTAQVIALPENEKKSKEKISTNFMDHAWFIAAAPAENPQLVLTIIIENGGSGGAVAAPMAKKIFEVYFKKDRQTVESECLTEG